AAAAANRPAPPVPRAPEPVSQPRPGRLLWPVDGPLTSHFGWRRHPIFGDMRFHAGIDIGAPYGTEVHAADDGVVTYAGPASGYGTLILISHGDVGGRDFTTGYAHQSALLVDVGEHVSRGQTVGRVGNEGNSTGPHLHFEVRRDGEPVDPLDWVSPP
ncbi:MAG: Peptidase, partial [Frankiales bacterium]|nr:Peptidase [Frankiales bacterium]